MSSSLALATYLGLSRILEPITPFILERRVARGKEDPARLDERLGRARHPRPFGRLVWLHGASVGEAMSMLPLIDGILSTAPDLRILVTTGTVTSAQRMAAVLPDEALHQFVPVDTAAAVNRFLDHWKPDLAIWIESEIWPRLIVETAKRRVPMALVNARLSARSAERWQRLPGMARRLFDCFRLISAQDNETFERLVRLGVAPERMHVFGNLKALIDAPCDPHELAATRAALGDRPVWLAASTHPGEEMAVTEAHQTITTTVPEVLTILAPRHPERGSEVAELMRTQGLEAVKRSEGKAPGPSTSVWIADTLGEMGLWYGLADACFVGASLVNKGGHTPFEPIAAGTPVLHGPHVDNFAPAYAALTDGGATIAVQNGDTLGNEIARLLVDRAAARALIERAASIRRTLLPDAAALTAALLALLEHPE